MPQPKPKKYRLDLEDGNRRKSRWVSLTDPGLTETNTDRFENVVLNKILNHHKDAAEEQKTALTATLKRLVYALDGAIYRCGDFFPTAETKEKKKTAEGELEKFLTTCACFEKPDEMALKMSEALKTRREESKCIMFFY